MGNKLNNKVAFITGGGRGLGAGLAARLLADGMNVFIVDLNESAVRQQVRELGTGAEGCMANVTRLADMEQAMKICVSKFGQIDVVVANAGILKMGSIESMRPANFEAIMQVNCTGVFNTIRAAIPYLRESKGYLQVVSSLAAAIHTPLMSHYAASKAAAEALADVARQELAPDGIDVGCVHPTFTKTAMIEEAQPGLLWGGHKGAFTAIEPEQVIEAMARGIHKRQRKIIAPKHIAPLVLAPGLFHRVAEKLSKLQGSDRRFKQFQLDEEQSTNLSKVRSS